MRIFIVCSKKDLSKEIEGADLQDLIVRPVVIQKRLIW